MKRLCVFCGARTGVRAEYAAAAAAVGQGLAGAGWGLVYGGGQVGLMGIVADAALSAGAEVTGVLPTFLDRQEIAHPGLHRMEHVGSLFERKASMMRLSDAFLALPGGIGTLDELLEVVAWRQLGQCDKPIMLLNTAGYFELWLDGLRQAVREGFLDQHELTRLIVADTPARLFALPEFAA
jgi:uncharacterized protein (TIGR00730 family)